MHAVIYTAFERQILVFGIKHIYSPYVVYLSSGAIVGGPTATISFG